MKSKSEVVVRMLVMPRDRIRVLLAFGFPSVPFKRPHDMVKSTLMAFFPEYVVILSSSMFTWYKGRSLTKARISCPKGGRRFKSCTSWVNSPQERRRRTDQLNPRRILLSKSWKWCYAVLSKDLNARREILRNTRTLGSLWGCGQSDK